eukprot:TRINITY_DN165_c0_g1_i18.p1 TRINITY_DN165_c0_g1~~TRINITY_DN165_c0_g1_i18.p1  ORF type:complete len:641 (+),score=27.80 TRINITY_DN165_c0_g1_i18:98-1924(+)
MLKVFNILLLVSMASMCRALANWQKFLTFSAVSIHLTPEGNVFIAGKAANHNLGFAVFDPDGTCIGDHLVNIANVSKIHQIIPSHNPQHFLVMGDSAETTVTRLFLAEVSYKGVKTRQDAYFTYREGTGSCIAKSTDGYLAAVINQGQKVAAFNYQLIKFKHNGTILWQKKIMTEASVGGCTFIRRAEDNEYSLIVFLQDITTITWLDSKGNSKGVLKFETMDGRAAIGTRDDGIVIVGKNRHRATIWKLSQSGTIIWRTSIEGDGSVILETIIEIHNGSYMAAGSINNVYTKGWLVKLLPDGTEKWHKSLGSNKIILDIIEAEPNVYYMYRGDSPSSSGEIQKYSIPSYVEGLHCAEKEQCGSCGLGFYWNYTSCVPCSVGCVECLDIDHCINCSSRYAKTEDNRCIPVEEPCNCDLPNLTPECREKCALPVCSSNSSLPFTYKTDNKKVCTCPDEMLSNETHCLPKTDVGCHPLCDICAGEYCLQCKNITGIFVSRTHSIAVKCQCDYGYQFNSTACIPVKRIHNVQSSESLVAIALGIIGGLVAVGSVAFIMYLKYRRDEWMHGENLPDIQTGKEQHTVEVSKEMEVHAITRDDERTGEIMFKRE